MEIAYLNIVFKSLNLCSDEKLTIIADNSTNEIAQNIQSCSQKIKAEVFYLEDYGPRPLNKIPKPIIDSLSNCDASLLAIRSVQGEGPLRRNIRILSTHNGARHAHCPNLNQKIMETGMTADPIKVQKINDKVYDMVRNCKEIIVKTDAGTDLKVNFSPKYKWINLGSIVKNPGEWTNLPGAEVFTYPANIKGTAVIDGVLGSYFAKYGTLEKTPLKLIIKNGKIISYTSANKELNQKLVNAFKIKNSRYIGEFAIGTNRFIKELIGTLLQDEKFPGCHIAFGNSYPDMTGGLIISDIHVDGVMKECSIWVDKRQLMKKGKFSPSL